jgi:carboxypeptidase family protein/TonB-dependent receptor-like protein
MKSRAIVVIAFLAAAAAFAQTESARISGRVTDLTGAVIVGAECKITNIETNVSTTTLTNEDGIYVIPDLHPATYRLTIEKESFRSVVRPTLQLYVQDAVNENFTLAVGNASESITVTGDRFGLQTDSAAVSTVVDDQFVQNMPLNGRSFQSLIALVPGVVFTSTVLANGQFATNDQSPQGNYFTIDGVSANFGVANSGSLNQSIGGTLPGLTASGGTNGLVSIDAMQEFRIQTSSYAAEYGHTPGAQISIVTKSGSNGFHGTAFDYLRNDIFDARNWFDQPPLIKPPLRQNDFGGTIGGQIWKNRTFFFFSYEGLRLQLPQVAQGVFYTAGARATVAPVYQPIINALPLPDGAVTNPGCDNVTTPCLASLNVAYSDPSRLNATSLRIDHTVSSKINLFVRYNHAPSSEVNRYWEELDRDTANIDTLTAGMTFAISPTMVNEFRSNWSRSTGTQIISLDNFHGAVVPPLSALFPAGQSPANTSAHVGFTDSSNMDVEEGAFTVNAQKQLNFVDSLTRSVGAHQLKFGIDYRRINLTTGASNSYDVFPSDYASVQAGVADLVLTSTRDPLSLSFKNYSLFGQDTWKASPHLTLTYGLRWEINAAPNSTSASHPLYALHGIFDSDPLAAVPGTLWSTKFGNFAPRFGVAYQITSKTVVRSGFGLFYDLGNGDVGEETASFPYSRFSFVSSPPAVPFDLTNPAFQPPPFSTQIQPGESFLLAVDPNLQLPFTWQWNVAVERELGKEQTFTATYLGSDARRLTRTDSIVPPLLVGSDNSVAAIHNGGYSHYNALQVQLQRRKTYGLQALLSYNLSKANDDGSSDGGGSYAASISQLVLPPLSPSDFDIRHSFSGAISYEIPRTNWGKLGNAVFNGWAIDGLERLSSAWPLNLTSTIFSPATGGYYTTQAEVVPSVPVWLSAPGQPGGKVLNPAAFTRPAPGQNGDVPRNSIRSLFSINQTDLAIRRRFSLTERVKLDFRVEYFNVFNHPMFGAPGDVFEPESRVGLPGFGTVGPSGTTNESLNNSAGTGQNPLYAVGGPRSGQFTLKLLF